MASVLDGLKRTSGSQLKPKGQHDLETALDRSDDARDIARDLLRRLPEYTGSDEESTARHELPQPQRIVLEQHTHIHSSQPDLEPELGELPRLTRGFPRWLQLAIGVALAIATAVISHWATGAR